MAKTNELMSSKPTVLCNSSLQTGCLHRFPDFLQNPLGGHRQLSVLGSCSWLSPWQDNHRQDVWRERWSLGPRSGSQHLAEAQGMETGCLHG